MTYRVPQPFFESIELNNLNDIERSIDVNVALKLKNRSEYLASDIKDRLRIAIICIKDPTLGKKYIDNNNNNKDLATAARQEGPFLNNKLEAAIVKICSGDYVLAEDADTIIYTKNFSAEKRLAYLAFVAVTYYDMGNRELDEGVREKMINDSLLAKEVVINGGDKVEKAVVFVADSTANGNNISQTSAGCVWTGCVHRNGENFEGECDDTRGTTPPVKVIEREVPNTTLRDYEIFDTLERVDLSPMKARRVPKYKNAYVSPLFLTKSENRVYKGIFTINFEEIVRDHCFFPRISSEQVLGLSEINSIAVSRSTSYGSTTSTTSSTKRQVIAHSSQPDTFSLIEPRTNTFLDDNNKNKTTGYITELTNTIDVPNDKKASFNFSQRTFAITDFLMQEEESGMQIYDLQISFKDGTILWVTEMLLKLAKDLAALEEYYIDLESRKNNKNFNFKNAPYVVDDQGPWQYVVQDVVEVISMFADFSKERAEEKMYLLVCPQTGTLKGVDRLKKLTLNCLHQLVSSSTGVSQNSSSAGSTTNKALTVTSGNKTPGSIEFVHAFVMDKFSGEENKRMGYNYLNTSNAALNSDGLSVLGSTRYEDLVKRETLKYFSPSQVQANNVEVETFNTNLSRTKFSFLTPNRIKIPCSDTFETTIHNSDGDLRLKKPIEYFNYFMDMVSYSENGFCASSKVSLSESTREKKQCDQDESSSKITTNMTLNYALTHAMSFLDVQVLDDYRSEEYQSLLAEELSKSSLISAKDVDFSLMEDEQEKDDDTKILDIFSNAVSATALMLPLMQNHLNICAINKGIGCLLQVQDMSKIRNLPNQYKAIYLSYLGLLTNNDWSVGVEETGNVSFFYLMNKNLVTVEVFRGYNDGFVSAPTWEIFKPTHMQNAIKNNKRYLFCRLRKGYENFPCPMPNSNKTSETLDSIPVQDKYFLMDVFNKKIVASQGPVTLQQKSHLERLEENTLLNIPNEYIRTKETTGTGKVTKQFKSTVSTTRPGPPLRTTATTTTTNNRNTTTNNRNTTTNNRNRGGYS